MAWCLGSGGGWHGVWVVVVVAWCLGSAGGGGWHGVWVVVVGGMVFG